VLTGDDGINVFYASAGSDTLVGNGGTLLHEPMTAHRAATGSDDEIWGQPGDDSASGGDGNDRLNGEADDDTLSGGAGDDYLDGSYGSNDVLDGGPDTDTCREGENNTKCEQ
jgi:Ca2+-binding RTX toxin-like protein